MAKTSTLYRRLPGTGSGAFETVRLYLASDHLLQVSSSGFRETYRRFYFREIQLLALRDSMHGRVWNGVWGFLAFLPALVALQVNIPAARVIWLSLAGIFLLLLAVNIARGPTCVCQVRTAVQTRTLASLNRLRKASKVIGQLRPLIEAAQGALPRDEIARRLDEARQGIGSISPAPVPVAQSPSSF